MNFFKFYIGDYQRDTASLSVTEHGAYLLMLQHHYATEKPLPTGKALHRMLRADSKLDRDAIDSVARRFWRETPEGLVNERAIEEFARAHGVSEINRGIAVAREAKKRARIEHENSTLRAQSVADTCNEQSTNQTPDTRYQIPEEKKNTPREARAALVARDLFADGLSAQVAQDWLAHRKRKRAPLTATAWAGIKTEAEKAGMSPQEAVAKCLARGWTGFEAAWVDRERSGPQPSTAGPAIRRENGRIVGDLPISKQEILEERNRRAGDEWLRQMHAQQENSDAIDA